MSDGLNDPVVGWLTDRCRSRWGRRKPFMTVGLPLVCLFYVLIWYPPSPTTSVANFGYATLILVLFFVAFTLYIGPYLALLPEIAPTTAERVSLSGLQSVYGLVGFIAGAFVTGFALMGGLGYQGAGWLVMVLGAASMALPFWGPRDRPSEALVAQPTPPFFRSVATTLANRPFQSYILSQLLFNLGLLMIVAAMPYMVESLLGHKASLAGPATGVALVSGVACVPLVLRVAARRGGKRALRLSMQWFAAWASLLGLLGPLGRGPAGLPLTLFILAVIGFAIGGLYALPNAILADITAHDRQHTGLDRQGMFFCVRGLLLKLAYSGAPWLVDQMKVWIPSKVTALALVGPVAALLCLVGDRLFAAFPEDEVRAAVEAG